MPSKTAKLTTEEDRPSREKRFWENVIEHLTPQVDAEDRGSPPVEAETVSTTSKKEK